MKITCVSGRFDGICFDVPGPAAPVLWVFEATDGQIRGTVQPPPADLVESSAKYVRGTLGRDQASGQTVQRYTPAPRPPAPPPRPRA